MCYFETPALAHNLINCIPVVLCLPNCNFKSYLSASSFSLRRRLWLPYLLSVNAVLHCLPALHHILGWSYLLKQTKLPFYATFVRYSPYSPRSQKPPSIPFSCEELLALLLMDLWPMTIKEDIQKHFKKRPQLHFTRLLPCSLSSITGNGFSLCSNSFLTYSFPT